MKTVQIVNPSEMKVAELGKPAAGTGEILVKIKYVGFYGSDLSTFSGRNPMVRLPVISGHEAGAVVEEIGPNVPAGFEKRVNVALNLYTSCGECASCRNGRVNTYEHSETLGVQRNGVMCGYAASPRTKIIPAGDISPRDYVLIRPMSVGFYMVSRTRVIDDEYVIVIGCGMVSVDTIVHAALRGATVIAVGLDDEKPELMERIDASYVINPKTENVHERMQQVMEGFDANVVIKAADSPVTYVIAMDEAGFAGRVAYISYAKNEVTFQMKYFAQKKLNIHGFRNALPTDFRAVIDYTRKGNYPVEELIPKITKPEGASEAIQGWTADPGKVFRILVEF